jgi:hypothetical protein
MTQQFLHDLHVLAVGVQQSRVGPSERVPADALSDTESLGRRLDVVRHHLRQPDRLLATFLAGLRSIRRKDVVLGSAVLRGAIPGEQVLRGIRIDRRVPFITAGGHVESLKSLKTQHKAV